MEHESEYKFNVVGGSAPVVFVRRQFLGQAINYDNNLLYRVDTFPAPKIVWLKTII